PTSRPPPPPGATARPCPGSNRPSAGHRRKERDLVRPPDSSFRRNVRAIEGRADCPRIAERTRVFLAAPSKPVHQLAHGRDPGGRVDLLLRLADPLPYPGEIQDLHAIPRSCAGPPRASNPSRCRA